jgi:hypothetical protein
MTLGVPHKDDVYASARSQYNLDPVLVLDLVAEMKAN